MILLNIGSSEKGESSTPPETQAAIRNEIAMDLDKALSNQ